jgi:hypothetical protein
MPVGPVIPVGPTRPATANVQELNGPANPAIFSAVITRLVPEKDVIGPSIQLEALLIARTRWPTVNAVETAFKLVVKLFVPVLIATRDVDVRPA